MQEDLNLFQPACFYSDKRFEAVYSVLEALNPDKSNDSKPKKGFAEKDNVQAVPNQPRLVDFHLRKGFEAVYSVLKAVNPLLLVGYDLDKAILNVRNVEKVSNQVGIALYKITKSFGEL